MRYAVLFSDPRKADVALAADAVARHYGVAFVEGAALARKAWGILAEKLEKGAAESFAALLTKSGAPALAIPDNLIEDLPSLQSTGKIEWEQDSVRFELKAGGERKAKASDLLLVAACAFKQAAAPPPKLEEGHDPTKRAINAGLFLVTGLPISIGGKKEEKVEAAPRMELVFHLDLYFTGGTRLRVDAQDFDYSGLKKDMGYAALENFRAVVERLAKSAPQALQNKGAGVLVGRKPMQGLGYEGLADLDKEARWLLTLKALNKGT